MRRCTISVAVSVGIALSVARPAAAAYDAAALVCRAAAAKRGAKLAATVGKALGACHKLRDRGEVNADTDCNDVAEADAKGLIERARMALQKSVGGSRDACGGTTPAAAGFFPSCPTPCDSEVPSVTTFADVAQCLICLIETEASLASATVMGSPAPPLGADEAKCRGTIGKSHGKHVAAILKVRGKCQAAAESDGAMDVFSCAGITDSRLDDSRDYGEEAIGDACEDSDLGTVDSCDSTSSDALEGCVMDTAESTGEALFHYLRGTAPGPPTWSEIQAAFAQSCDGAACHTQGGNSGGLSDLDDYDAGYSELVGALEQCGSPSTTFRVVPGDADASFLMRKLDHVEDCGSSMPLSGGQLSGYLRSRIQEWIDSGAPKN